MDNMARMVHVRACGSVVLAVLLFLWPGPLPVSQAATYYVDGSSPVARDTNPGTAALPFKTVNRATSLVNAGDTVFIKAGIYRETAILSRSGTSTTAIGRTGTTATLPITITAYPGHEGKVILSAAEPVIDWRRCTGPAECAGNPNWPTPHSRPTRRSRLRFVKSVASRPKRSPGRF